MVQRTTNALGQITVQNDDLSIGKDALLTIFIKGAPSALF
jgi:hypothetical protein